MIAIPKVFFLVLLEVILALLAVIGFLWYRARRRSGTKTEAADGDSAALRQRVAELEAALKRRAEESAGAGEGLPPDPAFLKLIREKHERLLKSIQAVETGLKGNEAHTETVKALVVAGQAMTAAIESSGGPEPDQPPEGFKEISIDDGPEETPIVEPVAPEPAVDTRDTVEPPGRGVEDVLLMMGLQVKMIREQEAALGFVQARLSGAPGEDGAEPPPGDEDLFEAQKAIKEAVSLLEAELAELKQLGSRPAGGPGDAELEASRRKVAELQSQLDKAAAQIESLEREYDILYSKTAAENPMNT